MDLLCRIACDHGLLQRHLADLGVLAMLGHDLGHDGTLPPPGTLEAQAATRVAEHATRLDPADRAVLTHVILATDPARVPANLERAQRACATPLDHLTALANEADVLASLLPELGITLSEQLATEWRPHDATRAAFAESFSGRSTFLRLYATPTPPARSLGLEQCIAGQIKAITDELDAMPRTEAIKIFRRKAVLF
jgi:predicted flap endonuclease-1-like 5' DNA nuclease